MIAYSETRPETLISFGGKYHFNYNIEEISKYDVTLEKTIQQFKYNFVEVADISRSSLIDAIITGKYSYSSQIGKAALVDCPEKEEYLSFVNNVKGIVNSFLQNNTE